MSTNNRNNKELTFNIYKEPKGVYSLVLYRPNDQIVRCIYTYIKSYSVSDGIDSDKVIYIFAPCRDIQKFVNIYSFPETLSEFDNSLTNKLVKDKEEVINILLLTTKIIQTVRDYRLNLMSEYLLAPIEKELFNFN